MNFLLKLVFSAIAVMLVAYLLPGVHVADFGIAFLVSVLFSLLNVTLKPLLIILTIPITFLTLGIFLLVINAVMVLLVDGLIDGFEVSGFWNALFFSLLLSLTNALLADLGGFNRKKDFKD